MRIALGVLIGLMLAVQVCYAESNIPVETILLEAQGESLEGQIAVGEVIRNRAVRGSRTHEEICLAKWQFSCWNDLKWARNGLKRASGATYQTASKAWEESESSNLTKGATHYANLSLCKPYWAKSMIKTATIGQHTFFREK